MTSISIFAFALLFFGLSYSSPVPLNEAGTPNTACSIGTNPSMNYVKAVTCLMESDVLNYMRDPSIPSFDLFRGDNWISNTFTHDTASCVSKLINYLKFVIIFFFFRIVYILLSIPINILVIQFMMLVHMLPSVTFTILESLMAHSLACSINKNYQKISSLILFPHQLTLPGCFEIISIP